MLEGREVDGKIGEVGGYFLDVNDKGDFELGVSVKINLVDEPKKLAVSKNIAWLEKAADLVGGLIGRPAEPEEVV